MKSAITCVCLSGLVLAAPALAQRDYRSSDADYVWARVVSVDPIVARTSDPQAREVCWEQPVEQYQPGREYPTYRRDPTTGTLVGALVGGALGSQVGGGSGKTAATVAGTLAGGKIGREIASRDDDQGRDVRQARQGYEEVCEMREDTSRSRDRVVGYDVAYELEGDIFNARTDAHPGDQIRVAVVPFDE